jgi:transposase
VSVLNPARVRQFARASGELAKTDPIDAAMLTAFGQAFTPAPTEPRTAVEIKLAALVTRRMQLIELRVAEEQRAATCADPALCKLFTPWLAQMEKQISKVEALIEELLKEHAPLAGQVQRLDDIMGVGRLTAVMAMATMPEPGTLNRRQAAAQHADLSQQLVETYRLAPTHIERITHHLLAEQALHQQHDQIPHIEEIAGLLTITEDADRQPLLRTLGEDTDHPGVRRGWILARPEDIEVSQADC